MTATSRTIKLSEPVAHEGRDITEVTLRRPKVGDLRRMDKVGGSDMEKTLWLLGVLSEMTPDEVDKIDAADLEALADAIAGFTGKATA